MTDATKRRFPVLLARRAAIADCPSDVPWSFVAPHEAQALANHGQSLQRLAERGGLAPSELVAVVEGRRWRGMELRRAVERLKDLLAAPVVLSRPDPGKDTT